jgi:hypothetical protein
MKIVGFVLTKNNSRLFSKVLSKIPKSIDSIFVSDDHSNDDIEELCKTKGIKFHKNFLTNEKEKRGGYGSNMKNALDIAFQVYDADFAVEIHGDAAQFNPSATDDAVILLKKDNLDLIVGSRILMLRENIKLGYPFSRMIPNLIISKIEKHLLKINITDFHSGFRIYSKNLCQKINYRNFSDNYLFSFEIILHAKKHNLKIGEVPVSCDYKSEHTSHKLFGKNSAFSYQIDTFKLIYNYFRKRL